MNSRRYISNIVKKDNFHNYYELNYVWNKDLKYNNHCNQLKETFYFDGKDVKFENKNTIKKICYILDLSKKELIKIKK